MANGEVSSNLARLWRFRLLEVGGLAQVVVHQLLFKGLIGGLGEHRLFFKDGEDTQWLCRESVLKNPPGGEKSWKTYDII